MMPIDAGEAAGVSRRGVAEPDDVADAVLSAVSRPSRVDVAEMVVRPNKDLNL